MNFRVLLSSCLFLLVAALSEVRLQARDKADKLELLPIDQSPKPSEWQLFMKLAIEDREAFWKYHKNRGKTLGDWAWEWRLAWVRVCGRSERLYCGEILERSLQDPAVVVRAEAATTIGTRFEGTGYKKAADLLVAAYLNPENHRNRKPLWVQFRILEAMKKIGGQDLMTKGTMLARQDPATLSYWKKLNKI
ncbi:hypothetical protein [Pseudobacteriovorax antillogorgiicola]|uniref:HEAT repeat domain-containing protein n=1 Tax=Pseudobacteriovorax antillogorgiicola TaxID=1513793 RepID=A0A1Y6C361_9BACT|nr:hypothetical protein [Pseudobacteriovorax antillogorgiicola]TCS50337.1 hypothetical protein EDD56_113155 [Pseudobacteriovorax antillogorgiicola]SMF34592.1 hypothetical protein SAMN06296036_110154 [Pseudobacteriovorax antillogorgiicola]